MTEAYIDRATWDGSDFVVSRQYEGQAGGLIRPAPLMFLSQHGRRLLSEHRIRGHRLEVARLV
jgi:hypothetical protein